MDTRMLALVFNLLLIITISESAEDVTTFANIMYRRGLPHGKGYSRQACVDTCIRRPGCWGVNHIGGTQNQLGECQLLLSGIATCDPSGHRKMPPGVNAEAIWVDGACPLQREVFGENSPFRLAAGKSLGSADPDNPCPGSLVHWRVHDDMHVVSGTYIRGPQTFLQCLDSCARQVGCAAVDFNFEYGACFHFDLSKVDSDTYLLEEATCCAHARIQCDARSTTTAPTTAPPSTTAPPAITTTYSPLTTTTGGPSVGTTSGRPYTRPVTRPATTASPSTPRTGTTLPPQASAPSIPDTGCPGPFLKFPFSGRQGGTPMLDLPSNTSEACKQHCLDLGDQCTGIDFDEDVSVCYTFSMPDPQGLPRGDRPCCDHYVKLDCEALSTRQCYQHGPHVFLANPNEHNVIVSAMPPLSPPDLVLVPCDGVCYQNLDHDADFGFFTLTRGCNTSAGTGRSWRSCVTPDDPFDFDKNCSCEFDRCNGVSTFLFDDLTCHYPFDDNANDLSGFNRHGQPHNVTFDPATAVRGYSAHFNGTSYIHFPAWFLVHTEDIGPDGTPLLSFTIAMWLLRPQSAQGSMTVLSTYGRDMSTIQIISELDVTNPWNPMQTIKASIIVNHTMYEVQAPAPLNEWFFVAFTLDGYRSPPLLALDINDLENIEPEASLELTNVTTLDELTIANRGLFLGKQAQIIEELDEPYFFEGYIDDFFCYDKALSYHELLALRDLSLPLP